MTTTARAPLAIVGIGCRYPGGLDTPGRFWEFVREGRDALDRVPPDRWDAASLYAPDWRRPGKVSVDRGGFLRDVAGFDAAFFGISPVEAARMDPQQRILLEVSYETLEDAGVTLQALRGSRTAVFVGISAHDYGDLQNTPLERANIGAHTNAGSALCMAANRLSYFYDLRGPSIAVDTACSSSLTAIHMACRAIWDGDAHAAFAGGVNCILKPEPQMGFSKGGFLSKDALCRSFDARANGYVRSEGAGLVLLKSLGQAVADGDRIYAVIRGSAVNQDGTTNGISAPSPAAQEELLRAAYRDAEVDPRDVDFVEAHGTGTFVGDPIEAGSIGRVIGERREGVCYLGSVKSNLGHLEPASGVAGVTKLALSLHHGTIAPNIHFEEANPNIDFERLRLAVPTAPMEWPDRGGRRVGGVNSFGFGGSNAHVVVQEYVGARPKAPHRDGPQIATLSARSRDALLASARRHLELLRAGRGAASFPETCAAAALRRSHHDHRLAIVAASEHELANGLERFLAGEAVPELAEGRAEVKRAATVFVFSGQGSQWWGMGRQLYAADRTFRRWIERLDSLLQVHVRWSLVEELHRDEADSRIDATDVAQPAIFALQVALAEMLQEIGIRPRAVVGHSIGEVAAAYVAGALSLEQAVLLIFHRSRVQAQATGRGRMLAVALGPDAARDVLAGREAVVELAAINGRSLVTLSGDSDAIDEIASELAARDVFHRALAVTVPFHSRHMEPLKEELLASLKDLKPGPTRVPLYSTVLGRPVRGEELDAAYWYRNVREPVRFTDAVTAQLDDGYGTFVEIGPHPIHSAGIEELLDARSVDGIVAHTLRRGSDEQRAFLCAVARLHCRGVAVDWSALFGGAAWVELPRYPWQREHFWLESDEGRRQRSGALPYGHPHLARSTRSAREGNNVLWDACLDARTYPYIADHRVQGPIVYPGAGHVDLVLAAASASFGADFGFLEDVTFENPLFLPDSGEPAQVQIDVSGDGGDYFIYLKGPAADDPWRVSSRGRINHVGDRFRSIPVDLAEVRRRATVRVPVEAVHAELRSGGLHLGPSFQGMRRLWRSESREESLGEVEVPAEIRHERSQFLCHPAVLDACFQTVFATLLGALGPSQRMGVYVPRSIQRVKWHGAVASDRLVVHGRVRAWDAEHAVGELWIYNADGSLVAEFHGFRSQYLKGSRGEDGVDQDRWLYEYVWSLEERSDQRLRRDPGAYLASPSEIRDAVQRTVDEVARRPAQAEYYDGYEPLQRELTLEYVRAALDALGLRTAPGDVLDADELTLRLGVVGRHRRLFRHLFELLARTGELRPCAGGFQVERVPGRRDPAGLLARLQERFPEFHHESELLGRSGPELAGVLQGRVDPLGLIFPDDRWEDVVQYYTRGFAFRKYNDVARSAIAAMIAGLPADQTLRVLEIGAGTGGMTQAILPVLPPERTTYVLTDLSPAFAVRAQQRFAAYPFVRYATLDVERDPAEQGLELHSFDVVVASDVVHATRDLATTLANLRSLLASRGTLMMLEVTNAPVYLDLIFGMTEGWWLFEDLDVRRDHATLAPWRWREVLERARFTDVCCYGDFPDNDASCQSVILARGEQREAVAIEPRSPAAPDSLAWLVFADRSGTAARVVSELEARGRRVLVLEPPAGAAPEENGRPEERGPEAEVERAVAAALERDRLEGILFAWGLDFAGDRVSPEAIARAERVGSATLLDVLRQLDAEAPARPPRLWILAAGSRSAEGVPEQLDPLQAGLRGVARCVMNELPRFETTFVDLGRPTTEVEIASFFGELLAPDRVDEVAFRGRRRYVNRLQRVSRETLAQRAMRTLPASGASYAAAVAEPGILDSVHLRRTQPRSPAANEVEVTVHASTLNFRDVMLALGLLGDEAVEGGLFGRSLGLECAGVVSAVGCLVQDLRVGDEVLATAPACLGGRAYPLAVHCVPKPAHLTWTEAATLPVAYTTAYFSLVHHCRLQPGEKVLIHAAAGGVGIAAVRIALALGAEVLATAGTPEKRAYVASLGVPAANVMDSRTLAFADLVLEKTGGRGVDVVLNSIAGPAVHQSVRCLAAYGRFVEIGKTDIYRNSKLGLRPFGNNLTYYGVDVDRLFAQKPELAGRLFRASIAFFREHGFPPHPVTSFPVARLADAFQLMGGSRHLGKVVIGMEGEVEVAPPARHELRADGTYLVTGGASGLGLGIASWMTTRGCRNLVLLSRTGVKTAAEAAVVQRMRERGVHVVLPQGSVEDREFLDGVLRRIRDTLPPLRGVQHAAMVLDDGSIAEMDHERYMRVFRPKAIGALNLHEATRDLELDHFVCYASISGVFGNPGQVGYVAANNFLDAFSRWRRAQGLPATTIDWGVIGDVGFVARNGEIDGNVSELLNKQGWRAFSLRQAESILEQVLLSDPVEIVATDCDWGVVGAFFPHAVESSRFAHLVAEERSGAGAGVATVDSALRSTLLDAGGERAAQLLLTHLRETFGRVLGAAPSKLDPAESITRFGLDSLMANQVRNWVQAKLGIDYSMMRILRGPSLNEMVAQLLAELGGAPSADAGASAPRDELERWVHRPRPVAKPRTRLFCLPYFAGGASAFLSWHTLLPADVEVCAVQFPGREERRLDAPFDDAVALVAALARVIRPLLDAPFAIYAHSSGAGIAFELCRHLRSEYDVQPVHLMVGGWGAPHLPRTYPVFEAVDERDLHDDRNVPAIKEHMRRLEIPESVVGNDALLAEMLPALRADVLLGKRYRYREEDPLVCPITAIAGARDSVVPVDHVREWRRHTSGPFHCVVVDGAHLFCRDNKEELLRCIAAGLAPPLT